MQNKIEHIINFQPVGKRVQARTDQSLLFAAQEAGITIASICGGIGSCDSCRIRLISGDATAPSLEEEALFTDNELSSGFRLACQTYPHSDLVIEIPPESLTAPQRLQIEGQSIEIDLDPPVNSIGLFITEPTIEDLRSDTFRVRDALREKGITAPIEIELPVLDSMSTKLRDYGWHIHLAIRNNTIVAVLPPDSPIYGIAVDVGTTKLAAYLCDIGTGEILSKSGAMNPQTAFGEDVISRISYSNTNPSGRKTLQSRLVETLNNLIAELCSIAQLKNPSITSEQIVEAVVVGNTAMHHLFAGLPVQQLGMAPYVPAVSEPMEIPAKEIGLQISAGAMVYLPGNIAGYVGADHVAMLLSTKLGENGKTAIALDIGTNTEISLYHDGTFYACSCASGPAFEGAHIQAGMRAAPGAIERVQVIENELRLQTIDNLAPIGICGSGILDAIACLRQLSLIDRRGSFTQIHPQIRESGNRREYVLVDQGKSGTNRDIVITRQDINEIQLAKGAIRTGIDVLVEHAGILSEDIEEFIIAGAFGSYINVPSAIQIGMFPDLPLNKFKQVGNAAGEGARRMLLSLEQRRIAEDTAKRVNYIELSTYPNFTAIFSRSLFL
jgi:uncharacterized 2Fe-2S/4Fe-4S cluster protein (DUF4445 family)